MPILPTPTSIVATDRNSNAWIVSWGDLHDVANVVVRTKPDGEIDDRYVRVNTGGHTLFGGFEGVGS